MTAPAWHSTETAYAQSAFDDDEDYAHAEFLPGERIGPPLARSGRKAMLRSGILILIVLAGVWAVRGDHAILQEWLSAVATTIRPARTEPATKPAALDALPSIPQQPASNKTSGTPDAAAATPVEPPQTTAPLPPATAVAEETQAPPLPPPKVDPADPLQKRAAAVGLNPDLSHVLLARLSPTDFRNAGIAIKTALAESPDGAVFVWPRQRKPELALFEVHFVAGAAPDCRRYVVTVTKDGWLTTALPMEKCGSHPDRPRRE